MKSLFPIYLNAQEVTTEVLRDFRVHNPRLATMVWGRVRPPNLTWYALNCTVSNVRCITIRVYDMDHGMRYGAVGKKIHTVTVTEFTEDEEKLLDEAIESHASELAAEEVARLERADYHAKILAKRKEMFNL